MPAGQTRWGYHRLSDSAARQLVAGAGIRASDLVLDLGAGDGAITGPLLAAGARVVAFELHAGRYERLVTRLHSDRLRVVRADVADLRLPRRPFKVVANPPYGISASIIRRLTSRGSRLESAHLVLPWYVVRRLAGHRASVFELAAGAPLSPAAFRPPAKCPAAVLAIHRAGC